MARPIPRKTAAQRRVQTKRKIQSRKTIPPIKSMSFAPSGYDFTFDEPKPVKLEPKTKKGSRVVIRRGQHLGKFATVEGTVSSWPTRKVKLRLDNGKLAYLVATSIDRAPKITEDLIQSVVDDVQALHDFAVEAAKEAGFKVPRKVKMQFEYEGQWAYHKKPSQCPSGRPRCPGHNTE